MTAHLDWLLPPLASAVVLWLDGRCRPRIFWMVLGVGAAGFSWFGSRAIGLEPAPGALMVEPLIGGLLPPLLVGFDVRTTSGQRRMSAFRWLSASVCFWIATVAVVLVCHYSVAALAQPPDSESLADRFAAAPPADSTGVGAGAVGPAGGPGVPGDTAPGGNR